jgi:hypothetical protein
MGDWRRHEHGNESNAGIRKQILLIGESTRLVAETPMASFNLGKWITEFTTALRQRFSTYHPGLGTVSHLGILNRILVLL